ncbi:MAG: cyclic nucleotide-binding domain-containing protein [Acidimicrobiales bacterium]
MSPSLLERRATATKPSTRQSAGQSQAAKQRNTAAKASRADGAKASTATAKPSVAKAKPPVAKTGSKSTGKAVPTRQRAGKKPTELLAAVPLFASLSPRHLNKVAQAMKTLKFSAGQTVVAAGDSDARFYLIVEGTAKVVVKGRKRAEVGPGAYFGEMAVIDGQPRSASVIALTDLETLSASRWNFEAMLKSEPTVMLAVLKELSNRLRECNSSLTD